MQPNNPFLSFGSFQPGTSFMHRLDVRAKIVSAILFIAACLCAQNLTLLGVCLGIVLVPVLFFSRIGIKRYLASICPALIIIVCAALMNLFNTPGDTLWSWGVLHISQEGAQSAPLVSLRLFNMILALSLVTLTTSSFDIAAGLEYLARPLSYLKIPVRELAQVLGIALRFVPEFGMELACVYQAQKSRGALLNKGAAARPKFLVSLMVPLFARAFRQADSLSEALEARGFKPGAPRARLHPLRLKPADLLVISFSAATWVFMLVF